MSGSGTESGLNRPGMKGPVLPMLSLGEQTSASSGERWSRVRDDQGLRAGVEYESTEGGGSHHGERSRSYR